MRDEGLENCLTLIDLLRTLPSTSVKNESSFSIMKLTKGKRRPRMKPSTLNDLLTVSLVSPPVSQFDPIKSIEHFLSSSLKPRRVDGYQRKKTTAEVTADDESEADEAYIDNEEVSVLLLSFKFKNIKVT
ncbi:uncharacterized protein LOC128558825 [Mercenaria mercenaria]|uniref:uncharacterized protein LOC128558825 n=1 Tax=Mercenaria mercenaria TaxID=6596 RepID=UPI00234E9AF1|nr:uncharacterized protein LOC128558825 [Mercenaria mercenaria]